MTEFRTRRDLDPDDVPVRHETASADEYGAEHYDDTGGTVRRWWGVDVAGKVNSVLFAILVALETLLALRFALLAFGANLANGFVDFIMDVSWPFVRPFDGAFANRTWDEGLIEINTLLAMGVWLIVFAIAMMLIAALLPRWREGYSERPARRSRIEHHP
ncbi:MAG: hypothetical protein WEB52_09370 [Dehalococcoidia bacterium]